MLKTRGQQLSEVKLVMNTKSSLDVLNSLKGSMSGWVNDYNNNSPSFWGNDNEQGTMISSAQATHLKFFVGYISSILDICKEKEIIGQVKLMSEEPFKSGGVYFTGEEKKKIKVKVTDPVNNASYEVIMDLSDFSYKYTEEAQ